jgi:hypothetical protein
MSNRHQRRRDLADFKRDAHKAHLVTYMIAADDDASLDRHPLLRRALEYWRGNVPHRRPICPGCRASFANDATAVAFLFATTAVAPTNASVTAFCDKCWHLPPADIECISARVLRQLLPNGRFLDAGRR